MRELPASALRVAVVGPTMQLLVLVTERLNLHKTRSNHLVIIDGRNPPHEAGALALYLGDPLV